MLYQRIAHEISEAGISVIPHFLSPEEVGELRADLKALRESGVFTKAAVGKSNEAKVRAEVRVNEQAWLEPENATKPQALLWDKIAHLTQALNQLYLGLKSFEGHYTVYPVGGFYERHLDAFSSDPKRTVSLILYLNEVWMPGDGGELRIYHDEGYSDIAPEGGTLVCFLSQQYEHEVLATRTERQSFTGWFKTS